jgi:hypothetical protein
MIPKLWLAFILVLLSSFANALKACAFYPIQESNRFSLLLPELFAKNHYSNFQYSTNLFSSNGLEEETARQANIDLWRTRCKLVPSVSSINDALYLEGHINKSNGFLLYLKNTNDLEALKYLDFLQKCEGLNSVYADPWERKTIAELPIRNQLITKALKEISLSQDQEIKQRYAFMAIRLAYYNMDYPLLKKIYETNFNGESKKTILYYWAMYFRAISEPDDVLCNYLSSIVFMHAPDKRFMVQQWYEKYVPLEKVLRLAKNKDEQLAIYVLDAIKNPGKALLNLESIYKLDKQDEALDFLVLREINKLEDWIYTPYYTYFEPSLIYEENSNLAKINKRLSKDRLYASDLLRFINSVNINKQVRPETWKLSKAYLLQMVQNYPSSLKILNSLTTKELSDEYLNRQASMLKSIALIANQKVNEAIIPKYVQIQLMSKGTMDNRFVFAIARELEYKKNTSDAAMLLSKVNNPDDYENNMYWKTKKFHATMYTDFYDNYFYYMDAQYTTSEINNLIEKIQKSINSDSFSNWKMSVIKNDIPRLYDLLGTKFMRENKLNQALTSFNKVNDTLWTSNTYSYKTYLNANPFYTNFYNEHAKTLADTQRFNKPSIVQALIKYLNKAEISKNPDRDYAYFLAANCYLNMTVYGNSWMMKRYYSSGYIQQTKLSDDDDFFNCTIAKQYYLKSYRVSKHKKFKALCLRMAGRCEKYRLLNAYNEAAYRLSSQEFETKIFSENTYYQKIKKQYPNYYEDLISNCESFEHFLQSRTDKLRR